MLSQCWQLCTAGTGTWALYGGATTYDGDLTDKHRPISHLNLNGQCSRNAKIASSAVFVRVFFSLETETTVTLAAVEKDLITMMKEFCAFPGNEHVTNINSSGGGERASLQAAGHVVYIMMFLKDPDTAGQFGGSKSKTKAEDKLVEGAHKVFKVQQLLKDQQQQGTIYSADLINLINEACDLFSAAGLLCGTNLDPQLKAAGTKQEGEEEEGEEE